MKDGYIHRAVSKGKIRFIREEEALSLLSGLDDTDYTQPRDMIKEYLSEDASTKGGHRFIVDGLQESAEARPSITSEQVWGTTGEQRQQQTTSSTTASTTIEAPLPPEAVLTAPEKGDPVDGPTPSTVTRTEQ